jgi:hypothetical protein
MGRDSLAPTKVPKRHGPCSYSRNKGGSAVWMNAWTSVGVKG